MEIHILLEGEQLGPFSEIQVRQYLGEGLVSPSDLATYAGMQDWQSLDQILINLANLPAPASVVQAATLPEEPPPSSPEESIAVEAPPVETPLVETVVPNVPETPPDSPGPVVPDKEPEPVSLPAMHDDAPPTLELEPAPEIIPPPAEPALPLTASQKTKRKLNKIVIQPILPLETATLAAPAPLTRKKLKTGKTALTLEPLRPTTALPPVTGFAPKEKKPAKTPIRTGQVALRDLSEKTVAPPKATPPPLPEAPVTPVAPAAPASEFRRPKPPAPLLPEKTAEISTEESWYQLIPPGLIYAGIAFALLVLCLVGAAVYLFFNYHHSSPEIIPPDAQTISPPPSQIEIQGPDVAPKTAADYRDRGLALQGKGDLDGAIQDYNQALALDPQDALAYYRRGLAEQTKGDLDAALNDYTQVIALDPKQANAFSNRAFIKQSKGDLDGALADYNQALVLNPKISIAYYNEGLIKVQKGDLDGAIDTYNRALDLDPQMAIAYYNRGVAKNTEGNVDGAIADYTQALTLNPKIARAYCDRGFARQSKGDFDGAIADYAQALALNPKMAAALYNRGLIRMEKGDLDGALTDYSQSIDLAPKNELAYYNRGLAQFGKGNLDEALADLTKYCDMAPRESEADSARLYLWLISTRQNPKGTADQALASALQNDWNSPPEEFSSKIAAFLLGHIRENDLIANAASPDQNKEPGQYCEAWYFAGMKKLLAGNKTAAIAYFQKSVATQQTDRCEYLFAQAELQALTQASSKAESEQ